MKTNVWTILNCISIAFETVSKLEAAYIYRRHYSKYVFESKIIGKLFVPRSAFVFNFTQNFVGLLNFHEALLRRPFL